jgi:hypothetical protein
MREIRTEVEIHASPERVWQVLTAFEQYAEWNPFLRISEGTATPGSTLVVTIMPEGGPNTTFRASVEVATSPTELRWIGHLGVPGLFDGRHRFELFPAGPATTRLVQSEAFRGLLVRPAFYFGVGDATKTGFGKMNEALRGRAEATTSRASPTA